MFRPRRRQTRAPRAPARNDISPDAKPGPSGRSTILGDRLGRRVPLVAALLLISGRRPLRSASFRPLRRLATLAPVLPRVPNRSRTFGVRREPSVLHLWRQACRSGMAWGYATVAPATVVLVYGVRDRVPDGRRLREREAARVVRMANPTPGRRPTQHHRIGAAVAHRGFTGSRRL